MDYADVLQAAEQGKAPAAVYAVAAVAEASRRVLLRNGPKQAASSAAPYLGLLVPSIVNRFPNDPATAWLMIEWAFTLETRGSFAEAQPVLRRVLAIPESALPASDALRRVALLHAGIVASRLGDAASANKAAAEAGLTTAQCALFDTKPVPQNTSIAREQFPSEAQRWRFEGHVEEAFDIASDGGVANVRTVLAYPPFVFGPDTERAVRRFRYVPPTLAGEAVGCSGQTVGVNYRLPGV